MLLLKWKGEMYLKNFEQQIDRLPLTNDYVFKRVFGKKEMKIY